MSGPEPEPEWWQSLTPESGPDPWWSRRRVQLAGAASALIIVAAAGYLVAGPGGGSDDAVSPVGAITQPAEVDSSAQTSTTDAPVPTTPAASPTGRSNSGGGGGGGGGHHRTTTTPAVTTTAGVKVPEVIGMNREAARVILAAAAFNVVVVPLNSADVPVDVVESQEPPAGAAVARGSTVKLMVSVGDGPTEMQSPSPVPTSPVPTATD